MAYNLRTRLHFLIRFAGFLVFLFGIFILASAIKIRDILTGELEWNLSGGHFGHNTCQYWAGIPTILTGLLLLAVRENHHKLKYISFCCVAVTMVLTLGVIIEEAEPGSLVHGYHKGNKSFCKTLDNIPPEFDRKERRNDCEKFKKADPWYYILLFATDIVLVLCFLVILLLFADWILFIAPKMIHQGLHNLGPRLHFLIRLAGFLVFFFGIFILASAIKIRDITGELELPYFINLGRNTCQYWAGIPTILTGLLLLAVRENHHKLKYISFCCVAVTMVLTLGVIIEEAPPGARIHGYHKGDDAHCKPTSESRLKEWTNDCEIFKKADPWYYILLFATDIVLVLCFLVIFLLFADWILFIAPKMIHQVLHNLRTTLHFLIRLAGFLVFFFGIFILASAMKIRDIITGELERFNSGHFGHNTCQYWAGIPTILTGLLLLAAVREKNNKLKYISFCCVAVTMVLTLGVIIEEAPTANLIHGSHRGDISFCNRNEPSRERTNDCEKFKKADPWYYILLFTTDIVLVLCFLVIFLLFADWILFIAPEMTHQVLDEVPEPNQGIQVWIPQHSAQVQNQMAWNSQNNEIPLQPLRN